MMGPPEEKKGKWRGERSKRQVTIPKPFAVGKYEVTVGQYAEFVEETKYKTPEYEGSYEIYDSPIGHCWDDPGIEQTNHHPVVCVNWHDASEYAYWLSAKTGHEYRLLTDAEWEYAARAGTTTTYHFGNEISPSQAHYGDGTVAVGSFPANAFGLHDMHGNVWEWVADCLRDDYTGAPTKCIRYDRMDTRVLRGGSSAGRSAEIAVGGDWGPGYHAFAPTPGFRVARTLQCCAD